MVLKINRKDYLIKVYRSISEKLECFFVEIKFNQCSKFLIFLHTSYKICYEGKTFCKTIFEIF